MPLEKRCSVAAFNKNVKKEIKAGTPKDQAIAIAYDTLRRACLSPETAERAKRERWTPKEIAGESLDIRFRRVAKALDEAVLGIVQKRPLKED
jgi:tripartite-type tricarboxylate transporter receptor subunit TctC